MLSLNKLPDKAYIEMHSFHSEHGPPAYCTQNAETKEQGLTIIHNHITHPKPRVNIFWQGSDGHDTCTVSLNQEKVMGLIGCIQDSVKQAHQDTFTASPHS
jgi:hypothetical protein